MRQRICEHRVRSGSYSAKAGQEAARLCAVLFKEAETDQMASSRNALLNERNIGSTR